MASLGQELKKAREERGVTLHDIAGSTHIGVRFLQAIENDNYDILPGGVFNRAFVRKFAKHVGMDEEQAVRMYEDQSGDADEGSSRRSFTAPDYSGASAGSGNGLLLSLVALVVLLACAYLAYEYFKAPASEENPAASTGASTTVQPTPAPAQSPTPEPVSQAAEPAASGLKLVLAAVDSDCWVKVASDADRGREQTLKAGETGEFTANEKFVLNLGNLPGLRMTINGRTVNPARLLPNQKGPVARNVIITRDNYQQFVD